MGQYVDVSPARQVESPIPIPELASVSWQDPREGTTGGGLVRGAHPVVVLFLPRFQHQNVRRVQRKREQAGESGKKREIYYREKRG